MLVCTPDSRIEIQIHQKTKTNQVQIAIRHFLDAT